MNENELEIIKIYNDADAILDLDLEDELYEITNFGFLKAETLLNQLLYRYDFVKKINDTVTVSLENLLVYKHRIEKAYIDTLKSQIVIYYKKEEDDKNANCEE